MTIVFSAATPGLIVMTADSAVTLEFTNFREYQVGRKSYFYAGVGCVTTWGARDNNHIGRFLAEQNIHEGTQTIEDLVQLVQRYLVEEFRPHELELDDVGYHVAGFDKSGRPHLWHVFYGFDRPKPEGQHNREYKAYDHTPPPGAAFFLYNGRNDLAHNLVTTILSEIHEQPDPKFDFSSAVDLARFSDFVARFAAEITPQVGPPFITYVIGDTNRALTIRNRRISPVPRDRILEALRGIGYIGE